MSTITPTTFLLLLLLRLAATATIPNFVGSFDQLTLTLSGSSYVTITGALCLTSSTDTRLLNQGGLAFFPSPENLRRSASFSISFVFGVAPPFPNYSKHSMALAFAPSLPFSAPMEVLDLFGPFDNSSSIVAVQLGTDNNHVGIEVNNHVGVYANNFTSWSHNRNNLTSINATSASSIGLTLNSGDTLRLWVDYNASTTLLSVSLARLREPKPRTPLLSSAVNLSSLLTEETYVGFSAFTSVAKGSHYVLGWSFGMDGYAAEEIDPDHLPKVPTQKAIWNSSRNVIIAAAVIVALGLALICGYGVSYWVRRKRRMEEFVEEEDEISYGPNKIKYKELHRATRGFKEDNLVGVGGFGRVYKGTLNLKGRSGGSDGCGDEQVVAVKRIAQGSRQGVKEFVAEISSMARLRHRNLVHLIGYCRRRDELLLVYDYMPNGSLDKFLYGSTKVEVLGWTQRFRVARGVAEGLLYLHEGWEQLVVHRDVKASNVLLDADFNGRLSDFGLAKIFDRIDDQDQTTRVVGTLGYLAPEMARTGKATTFTDVYAFGAFLLEVACGKRPMAAQNVVDGASSSFLVDWVTQLWKDGDILGAVDPRLDGDYVTTEAKAMLKLGVLCSHEVPAARPSMRQVVQALDGDAELPVALPDPATAVAAVITAVVGAVEGENHMMSFPSPAERYGNEHSSLSVEFSSRGLSL